MLKFFISSLARDVLQPRARGGVTTVWLNLSKFWETGRLSALLLSVHEEIKIKILDQNSECSTRFYIFKKESERDLETQLPCQAATPLSFWLLLPPPEMSPRLVRNAIRP